MILGPGWAKRTDERTMYVAVIEHVDENLHIHLALSCGPQFVERIAAAVPVIWKKMIPTSSVVVEPITDAPGWGNYIAKAITPQTSDLLLLSLG
jgi:hypothetical protein